MKFCPYQWLSCAIVACVVAGCSQRDANHGVVTGIATLDGQPLPSGSIRFTPEGGHVSPVEAAITAGKFSATVPLGDCKVAISAQKVIGKRKMYETPDSPVVDITAESLPAQYNSQSTLTLKVVPGPQQQNYDLKSGK